MDFNWLYAILPAIKKGIGFFGRILIFVGSRISQAVQWANAGLPTPTQNGEKDKLNERYQKLVDQMNIHLVSQSLELQRQSSKIESLDQRLNIVEPALAECKEDRDEQRKKIEALTLLSGANSQDTVGGK